MTRITTFLALCIVWLALLPSARGQTNSSKTPVYDITLAHGRVIDPETKLDAVRNVGVTDGNATE